MVAFALLLVISSTIVCAQVFLPFPQGFGVEIGGGHNQLLWHIEPVPPFPKSDHPRQELSFTPTMRMHYEIHRFVDVQVMPFVGYNQFGGRSLEDVDCASRCEGMPNRIRPDCNLTTRTLRAPA